MKIDKQYIIEAKRIINDYNDTINNLKTFEIALEDNKQILISLQQDLIKLNNTSDTDLSKKIHLHEIMLKYDIEVDKLHKIMMPYLSKLEDIKKNSHVLYKLLHEKYPSMTDKQLQEQIFLQIEQL
mgnify:CR=1 FL=1